MNIFNVVFTYVPFGKMFQKNTGPILEIGPVEVVGWGGKLDLLMHTNINAVKATDFSLSLYLEIM